jgi:rod shape determining protein RodA
MVLYIQTPNQKLLEEYQVNRIMAFLNQEETEYDDDRYQQEYSMQAIGSGQLYGKGYDNEAASSIKNAGYIAEAQNDFIFAVIGEELGFIGGCFLIALFSLIVFECIRISVRAKDFAGRMICCGMAAFIAYQSFINIGVATALLPNTGIPLPFISKGVSSLIGLFGGMGVVLNISLQKSMN